MMWGCELGIGFLGYEMNMIGVQKVKGTQFSNHPLRIKGCFRVFYPIGSMYAIFTYIWLKLMINVGKYTIHGSLGYYKSPSNLIHSTWQLHPSHGPAKQTPPLVLLSVDPHTGRPARNENAEIRLPLVTTVIVIYCDIVLPSGKLT